MIDLKPRSVEELGIERKPFYTPGEVAGILKVSDQKVLNMIHAPVDDPGHVYAVVVGPRTYRIPFGSLLRLVGITPEVRITNRAKSIDAGIKQELAASRKPAKGRKIVR